MATIAQLDVIYSANTRPLTRGLKDARRQSKTTTQSIVRGAGRMARSFRGTLNSVVNLRSAIGVLAGSAGIGLLVRNQMKAIDSTAKFSDRLNVQVEEMTALHRITERSGSSKERLNKSLEAMSRRIADAAKGTGEAQDALASLNLNAKELNEMGLAQQFELISNRMQGVATANERASIAADLMSRQGIGLLTTMKSLDREGLQPTIERLEQTGEAFNRVDAAKVEQANDAITEMQGAFSGVMTQLTIELAPAITAVAEEITDLTTNAEGFKDEFAAVGRFTLGTIGALADGVHTLKIGFQGVKLIAVGVGAVFASVLEGVVEGLVKVVDTINEIVNTSIRGFNMIPGVNVPLVPMLDDSEMVGNVRNIGDVARHTVEMVRGDLHDMLMEPLPSQAIDEFVANAQSRMADIKPPTSGSGGASGGGNGGGSGGVDAAGAALEQQREQQERRLEVMRQGFMSERDLEQQQFEAKKEQLQGFREAEMIGTIEHLSMLRQLEANHENKKNQIRRSSQNKAQKFMEASAKSQFNTVAGWMVDTTSVIAQESKKAFEINKAASIAQATIKGYDAATSAWAAGMSTGGPWAPAVAAAYMAASLAKTGAQISAISSTSFSGGGSSGGGAAPSVAGTPAPPVTPVSEQQGQMQTQDIVIRRNSRRSGWTDEEVEDMFTQIREKLDDGAQLGKVRVT